MRLIDADALKSHYAWWKGGTREMTMDEAKGDFDTIIDLQPEVIVHCKDCRWWQHQGWYSGWCHSFNGAVTMAEAFCSRGKKNES